MGGVCDNGAQQYLAFKWEVLWKLRLLLETVTKGLVLHRVM